MNTNHVILAAIGIICLTVCISIAIITPFVYFEHTHKIAVEQGLEQSTLPGRIGVYWVYPDMSNRRENRTVPFGGEK